MEESLFWGDGLPYLPLIHLLSKYFMTDHLSDDLKTGA